MQRGCDDRTGALTQEIKRSGEKEEILDTEPRSHRERTEQTDLFRGWRDAFGANSMQRRCPRVAIGVLRCLMRLGIVVGARHSRAEVLTLLGVGIACH